MPTYNELGSGGAVCAGQLWPTNDVEYAYDFITEPNLSAIKIGIAASTMTNKTVSNMRWKKRYDICVIKMSAALSGSDKIELDGIVSTEGSKAHDTGYFYNEANSTQTASQTTWKNRASMTKELPTGDYRIGVSFNWAYSHADNFIARIRMTGAESNTIWEMSQQPATTDLTVKHDGSGFGKVTLLGGNYTIKFQYKCSDVLHTAQTENVHLEVQLV